MIAPMSGPKDHEACRVPSAHRRLLDAVRFGLGIDPAGESPGIDAEVARLESGLDRAECARFLSPDSYLELPIDFDPDAYEIRPAPVTRRLVGTLPPDASPQEYRDHLERKYG